MKTPNLYCGKSVNGNKWISGFLCPGTHEQNKWYISITGVYGFMEVIPESIGLYTGCIDKNGAMIFDGSIIKYYGAILLVAWINPITGFRLKPLNSPFKDNFDYDQTSIIYLEDKIEVIGNSTDNKELL